MIRPPAYRDFSSLASETLCYWPELHIPIQLVLLWSAFLSDSFRLHWHPSCLAC